ncbi:V-type proton ATPase subunit F family protein [Haploplasma axanthum]|nr:hypothetical protein [Haploplasma axanthum]
MNKIFVLSNKIEVHIFKAIGFETRVVSNENFKDLISNDELKETAIIYFDLAIKEKVYEAYKHYDRISLIPLPFKSSEIGKSEDGIRELVKKSVGVDLL